MRLAKYFIINLLVCSNIVKGLELAQKRIKNLPHSAQGCAYVAQTSAKMPGGL